VPSSSSSAAPIRSAARTAGGGSRRRKGSSTASRLPARRSTMAGDAVRRRAVARRELARAAHPAPPPSGAAARTRGEEGERGWRAGAPATGRAGAASGTGFGSSFSRRFWHEGAVYGSGGGIVLGAGRDALSARPPRSAPGNTAASAPSRAAVSAALAAGFFTIPPGDRDESRFAQATRQMVETGDYVRIRFGEVERNKKPAGIHWAQAGSVHALEAVGVAAREAIWAYRIPSLLGAIAAVLATFHFGRTLVGRRAAFLGSAMLAGCFVLAIETHIAKTDAALLGTIVVVMGLMGRAYLSPGTFTARQAAAFWLVLGVSVLLKGPIGPAVPLLAGVTLAGGGSRLAERRALAARAAAGLGRAADARRGRALVHRGDHRDGGALPRRLRSAATC
jgi:hypothetical protein